MHQLFEMQQVEPIDELVRNNIADLSCRAAIELDNLRFWIEEKEWKRPLNLKPVRKLSAALLDVASSCPGDEFGYSISGLYALFQMEDQKKAFYRITDIVLELAQVETDMDIDRVTDVRNVCLEISRKSSPYEGPTIRY